MAKSLYLKLLAMSKTELHRGIPESLNILEAEKTKGLLKKGYQAIIMSKGDIGEAEFQGTEVLFRSKSHTSQAQFQDKEVLFMSKGNRRILEALGILEAEYTRAVVARTLPLKLLTMYKTEFLKWIL